MPKGGVILPILSEFRPEGIDKAIREFKKLETNTEKIGFGLQKAFLPATAALGGLAAAAIPAIKAASDLEEAQSKIGVVFGESAAQIESFADTAASSIGQSKQSVFDAAGVFGTFGKAAGLAGSDLATFSTDFIALASDLASFNNTTPEQAIEAIGAALRGESEPLRSYGVLLDDAAMRQKALELGIVDTVKNALTPQQKILAAQALIFEQTGDAQGDFERTSGSLANQMKTTQAEIANLTAEVGQVLLPVAKELIGIFRTLVGFVSSNQQAFLILAGVVATFSAAVVAANVAMKVYAGVQAVVKVANAVLGTSFEVTASKMAGMAAKVGLVTAAIGAAVFIYQDYQRAKNKVRDLTAELVLLLDQETGGFDAVAEQQLAAILSTGEYQGAIEALGFTSEDYLKFIKGEHVPGMEVLEEAYSKGVGSVGYLAEELGNDKPIRDNIIQIANLTKELGDNRSALKNAADEQSRTKEITDELSASQSTLADTFRSSDATSKAMADSMAAAEAAMAAYEDQTREANGALQELLDTTLTMFNADLALEEQIAKTEEAIFEYALGLADGTLKGRELEAAQRALRGEALQQADAAVRAAAAQAELAGETLSASDQQRIMVESLAAVADALDPSDPLRKELVDYIQQLGLIPSVKETVIRTIRQDIIQQSIVEATQFSPGAIAAASRTPRVSRNIGGPVPGILNTSTPIMAHGGEYVLSADVVDAIKRGAPSRGLGRGGAAGDVGGNVINVTVTSADPQAVIQAIRQYNRTNGPAPIRVAS
jgi:hypothetical protein